MAPFGQERAVLDRFVRRAYRRLGSRYSLLFPLAQDPPSLGIATILVVLLTSYYDPSGGQLLAMIGVAWATTIAGILVAHWRGRRHLALVDAWRENEAPSPEESIAAWDAATNFPVRSFRANSLVVSSIAGLPALAFIMATLHLSLAALPALLVATATAAAYATALSYFTAEFLMRPVVEDIAGSLPEEYPFTANGLLIRKRLKILLPVFTAFVGLIVAALVSGRDGTTGLTESVAAAVGVGLLLSVELTVLLTRSVTAPIGALRRGVMRVREGDYDARVPVVTSDELGELSHDFNLMSVGLAERERMREAFGTYLDEDVARLILSGQFPPEGVELTVSIMFVDVIGFTSFAERAEAPEVVAALNALFEVMVPVVARHGGHVDKFMGDGMLAVFGAPEGYADHADRAVAAGLEIVRAVNGGPGPLRIGVGINTGRVVAGSIGGAGRLNFSVIGDAVNVSARVEAATRDVGEDLLITRATCEALTRELPLASRGTVPLKGKAAPVEVLAFAGDELAPDVVARAPRRAPAPG
jgi:class 3 adenylate cyclase